MKASDLPKDHPRFKAFHDRFPIPEDRLALLREDIVRTKQVRDPLVVWRGYLVDGYHRKAIIIKEDIKVWNVVALDKDWTEEQVYDWMIKNQAGRRNLTEQQLELLIGETYNREKAKTPGNPQLCKVCTIGTPPKGSAASRVAKETGKSARTITTYGKHQEIYQDLLPDIQRAIDSQPPGKKLKDGQWNALDDCDNQAQVARNIRVHKMSLEDAYEEAMGKKLSGTRAKKKPPPDNDKPGPLTTADVKRQIDGVCKSIVKHRTAMAEWLSVMSTRDGADIKSISKALDEKVYIPLAAIGKGLG